MCSMVVLSSVGFKNFIFGKWLMALPSWKSFMTASPSDMYSCKFIGVSYKLIPVHLL